MSTLFWGEEKQIFLWEGGARDGGDAPPWGPLWDTPEEGAHGAALAVKHGQGDCEAGQALGVDVGAVDRVEDEDEASILALDLGLLAYEGAVREELCDFVVDDVADPHVGLVDYGNEHGDLSGSYQQCVQRPL